MSEIAYVALGSNLGDRAGHLATARAALRLLEGTSVIAESDIEETEPIGQPGQDPYLNQMIAIETTLSPAELLSALHAIEDSAGRTRTDERWGSRTLDLDIVLFSNRTISEPGLTVPHPALREREFWQRELAQLGGDQP